MSKSWRRAPRNVRDVLFGQTRVRRKNWWMQAIRGGETSNDENEQEILRDNQWTSESNNNETTNVTITSIDDGTKMSDKTQSIITERLKNPRKIRHTSELIQDLRRRSGLSGNDESIALRYLISTRTKEYLENVLDAVDSRQEKLPHPRKLLHFLAPKIPAIKQSPDVNLRICSALSDMDSGVAACLIGTLAHVCEIYDKHNSKRTAGTGKKPPSVAPDITTDRRFGQLVECVLSGVNVKKRKREALDRKIDPKDGEAPNIEDILHEEDAQEDEGLNIRDSCRAAWGLAILGAQHLETLGNEKVLDILLALSLRVREMLLARLQNLRTDELQSESSEFEQRTTEERLNELAEELAEDAGSAMWTFACVKACTGMRSAPLFETCCSILCQDPIDLRRRVQQGEDGRVLPNIGASDVVDRLARSERDISLADSRQNATNDYKDIHRDSLLDWLSPTEVNDVLWALALHGNNDGTSSSDEITLSETAATLREISFDRLFEWLNDDLALLSYDTLVPQVSSTNAELQEGETMTVEVVDAATLLKAQNAAKSGLSNAAIEDMPTENITITTGSQNSRGDGIVQAVQVVDAAALLASKDGDDPIEVETEVILTPSTFPDKMDERNVEETLANANSMSDLSVTLSDETPVNENLAVEMTLIFSPHDLSSIAWAVTELRDPLQDQVVDLVIRIFNKLGPSSTDTLTGGDLSNLAWAISRFENRRESSRSNGPSSESISILQWIAQSAVQKITTETTLLQTASSSSQNVLRTFQPPELGRLLWAVATTMSTYSGVSPNVRKDNALHHLAVASLLVAGSDLSLFATEDLVRISWAFLELSGETTAATDPAVIFALGRLLVTIEGSLHQWERGQCPTPVPGTGDAVISHDSSLFSSFFGRPRTNLKILEELIGDKEDEDEIELAPLLEKPQLPKLQDLSIDPSTLCKAACGFSRFSAKNPSFKGSWTLTRVAVRLLSSRNARLMKVCSIHDIVRLCEAAALSEISGHGREIVIGLFVRVFLRVLNDTLSSTKKKDSSSIDLERASPSEIATLLWALGELGVRHTSEDDNRGSAYRRMRLVSVHPLLTIEQLQTLNPFSLKRLLRGLVAMKFVSSDRRFLLAVLLEVKKKANNLVSCEDLCDVAESLSIVKEAVGPLNARFAKMNGSKNERAKEEQEHEPRKESAIEDDNTPEAEQSDVDNDSVGHELSLACDDMLRDVAEKAAEIASTLSCNQIRRLLVVYSFLPFEADGLVKALAGEVAERKAYLNLGSESSTVGNLLQEATVSSILVNQTLFGDVPEESRMTAIKNGIKAFFMSSQEDGDKEELKDETALSEEISQMIQQSTARTARASQRYNDIQASSRVSPDRVLHELEEGAAFELGRCQELIESYNRVEFSTGTRKSRYDHEHRKDIAKRVLSRLIP